MRKQVKAYLSFFTKSGHVLFEISFSSKHNVIFYRLRQGKLKTIWKSTSLWNLTEEERKLCENISSKSSKGKPRP